MDKEDKRKNDIILFVRDAMPDNWRDCANELRDSAELLWNDKGNKIHIKTEHLTIIENGRLIPKSESKEFYSGSRSYFLLAGFALENLLKGYLVACDSSLITNGSLHRKIKTHKISQLINEIGDFELGENESEFCVLAEQAIPYWGRYPIPLAFNEIVPEVGLTDELRQGFLSTFDRLDKKLYMKICDGWDSGVGPRIRSIFDPKYESEENH